MEGVLVRGSRGLSTRRRGKRAWFASNEGPLGLELGEDDGASEVRSDRRRRGNKTPRRFGDGPAEAGRSRVNGTAHQGARTDFGSVSSRIAARDVIARH